MKKKQSHSIGHFVEETNSKFTKFTKFTNIADPNKRNYTFPDFSLYTF